MISMTASQNTRETGWDTRVAFQKNNPVPRILIAEDDHDIRRLNTEILLGSGYKVDAAPDGAIAWEILQLKSYHLLITDFDMPNMTGLQLIKKARAASMALPVIMMHGRLQEKEIGQHSALQIRATLPKPYYVGDLLKTVKEVLESEE